MKTAYRFTLIGLFAAMGAGLAICVGFSAAPPADPPQRQSGQLVAWATTSPDPGPPATKTLCRAASAADQPAPARVAPSGPLLAELHPPRAAQYLDLAQAGSPPPALGANPTLEQALEYLQRRMAPAATAETVPPPPPTRPPAFPAGSIPAPTGGSLPAFPGGSLPPAAGSSPTFPGGSLPPAVLTPISPSAVKSSRPIVKADPEGDGKLTIHIQNSDIREVLDLLSDQGGLNILAGKDVQGKVSASLTGVDIDSALDAILRSSGYTARRQGKFIFVGTPEEFNSIEQSLDRIGTRVYRPNYVTSAELKALIQPLMTEKVGVVSVSSPAEAGIAASDSVVGGDKFAGGDVVLVRDYEAVLTQVDQVVAEVDVKPLQVAIEAMILSVKLDDSDQFGVNFELLRDHMRFGWGSPLSAFKDFAFKGGLKFGYLDKNVGVFLDALESIATTDVIATPRLMTLNKQRAEILIGEKKGYVSTTVTETASTQAVDFLEIGAQLRLRPFISRDGLIRMEVHPELSDGNVEVTNNFTLPNKTVTEVTTNIMVRDGCTVVIGGLIKNQLTNSITAIPVLGALPWVGPLFRTTKETTGRHEVIVLITPRIVYEPGSCQEGDKAACEFHRRQAVDAEKMSPLGRRSIARRYFRLAQAAWEKGDRDTALRFAELAVHFDPLNRAAIDLRADIWQGKPGGDHALDSPPESPSVGNPLDGPEIADWVLDDLQHGSAPPAVPLHPRDPGQPGLHKDIIRPRSLQ